MNEPVICFLLMLLSAAITATSQILLKLSANKAHRKRRFEYFNPLVVTAYALFGMVLLLNVYIYTRMDYRFGVVMNALASLLVMLLSVLLLKEKLTCRRVIGNGLVLLGVIVFTLF